MWLRVLTLLTLLLEYKFAYRIATRTCMYTVEAVNLKICYYDTTVREENVYWDMYRVF